MSPNNELNIDQYKKYLSGTMTAEELASFERKLELDPFAQEAMEGFTQMEQPVEMIAAITSIEAKIGARTGIEKTKTSVIPIYRILSIAAVLTAVIGGGFLVSKMLSTSGDLAENHTGDTNEDLLEKSKKDQSNSPIIGTLGYTDTITLNFSDNQLNGDDMLVEQEEFEQGLVSVVEETSMEASDMEIDVSADNRVNEPEVVEEEMDEIPLAEFASKEDKQTDEISNVRGNSNTSDIAVAPSVAAPSEDGYMYNSETVALNDASISQESVEELAPFADGLKNYQNSRYNDAVNSFGKSISSNQKVAESNYYLGLSYMSLNKGTKAMKAFDNVIGSASSLKNNAKWYKASILVDKGKNAEAKTLLLELVNSNSSFKQSAQEKLDNL